MKNFAFTLAETLIVIGIIGVVAALTIPNLTQSTNDKEKVAKLKKEYSVMNDALGRATAVYGPLETWFVNDNCIGSTSCSIRFANRMMDFLKVSKNCGMSTEGCFASSIQIAPDGTQQVPNYFLEMKSTNFYMIILADGTSVGFNVSVSNAGFQSARIRLDLDGPNKGKNQIGNDHFDFNIGKDSIQGLNTWHYISPDGSFTRAGDAWAYSTAWVLANDNMDYLKCDNLNWTTKTTCK